MQRHGAGYSNDLGTSEALSTSYGDPRGAAEILTHGRMLRGRDTERRNPEPDSDMHILTSEEAVTHLARNCSISRMEASTMLGALKHYARGYYDSRVLDEAVKAHKKGKKFVMSELEKQQHGPDKEVFHLLDRAEAVNAVCKETGCNRDEALAALQGRGDGIPAPPKYGGNYIKDTDLADWLKKHSQKIAVPDPRFA